MESLIAKQNISRRFRSAPAIRAPQGFKSPGARPQGFKAAAPVFFLLKSQKPQKRRLPSVERLPRFAERRVKPGKKPRVLIGEALSVLRGLGDVFSPGQENQRGLKILSLAFLCLALILSLVLMALKFGGAAYPMDTASFELPLLPQGSDLLSFLENAAPNHDVGPESGMIDTPLPLSLDLSYHVLKKGETIDSVAKRYGRDRDTIISMNGIVNVKRIASGTKLKIPNMNGIIYSVKAGDSLARIAGIHKVSVTAILDANNLDSYTISKGQSLFIPGAKLDRSTLRQALGELFAWPVRGRITSVFGYRNDPFTGVRRFHGAIDIMGQMGQEINAAVEGRVVETGHNPIYGNYVILAHAGGYQSFYAHLNRISVTSGQSLQRGAKLGEMGNTGYSTGTHLHFAIYKRGQAVNPIGLLPK